MNRSACLVEVGKFRQARLLASNVLVSELRTKLIAPYKRDANTHRRHMRGYITYYHYMNSNRKVAKVLVLTRSRLCGRGSILDGARIVALSTGYSKTRHVRRNFDR